MTYSDSILWWDNLHKKDQRAGFIASLSIHAFLFLVGTAIFVKTAQYNVQAVPQSTSVELVEAVPTLTVTKEMAPPKAVEIKQPEPVKVQERLSQAIRTEANPNYFQNPPPSYPELAKEMKQEGLVVLAVNVDRQGVPISVEIRSSSGYRLLDQAALKAVRHWKFQPGKIGDLPVESRVDVPVRFRLEENNGNSIRS